MEGDLHMGDGVVQIHSISIHSLRMEGDIYRMLRIQNKIISMSIISMVAVQACDLIFGNLAAKHLYWLPLLYLNFILPLTACIYLLLFYNPAFFVRRKKPGELMDD